MEGRNRSPHSIEVAPSDVESDRHRKHSGASLLSTRPAPSPASLNVEKYASKVLFDETRGSSDRSAISRTAPIPPYDTKQHFSADQFLSIINEVRAAISLGIQPIRISQGSSGSYFCKNRQGQVVGVFKPKNEEPYGQLNPKWTKWLHKTCCPCCFGRSW